MAVKNQFESSKLVACMELHTFSSLNKAFLNQYVGTMDSADFPIVYFNPKTLVHKKLPAISVEEVKQAFANEKLFVFTETEKLESFLLEQNWANMNLLLMSSGNFGGLEYKSLAEKILVEC